MSVSGCSCMCHSAALLSLAHHLCALLSPQAPLEPWSENYKNIFMTSFPGITQVIWRMTLQTRHLAGVAMQGASSRNCRAPERHPGCQGFSVTVDLDRHPVGSVQNTAEKCGDSFDKWKVLVSVRSRFIFYMYLTVYSPHSYDSSLKPYPSTRKVRYLFGLYLGFPVLRQERAILVGIKTTQTVRPTHPPPSGKERDQLKSATAPFEVVDRCNNFSSLFDIDFDWRGDAEVWCCCPSYCHQGKDRHVNNVLTRTNTTC